MSSRAAVNVFFFINGFVFATWASRLPKIQEVYVLDHKTLGLVLLAHSIGALVAMPVTGWMISVKGSRYVTKLSGLLFTFFFISIPLVPSSWMIFIPYFMVGMATGVMDVAMNAQAVEIEKKLARPIMTMFHALFSIGMVIGAGVGGLFISYEVSLIQHFLLIGGVSLITLVLSSRYLYRDIILPRERGYSYFVLPNSSILGLGVIAFCCMMGEGAMSDWSTSYMQHVLGSPKELHALGLMGFASMMTIGRVLGDRGRSYCGDDWMLMGGAVMSLGGMILILSLAHTGLVILGFGLVGLGLSNIVPIVYSVAGSLPDLKPGMGIAMSTTIGYSGFLVGPAVIGWIADIYGLRMALVMIAVFFMMMTILIYVRQQRQTSDVKSSQYDRG